MSKPTFTAPDGEELEGFDELLEHAFPETHQRGMLRVRPYEGQPHTAHGERGKTEVKGLTFRDLRDCFIRACFQSSPFETDEPNSATTPQYEEACKGEHALLSESDLYQLDFERIDIVAVAQNLTCEVEKVMGIYPNVPGLEWDLREKD